MDSKRFSNPRVGGAHLGHCPAKVRPGDKTNVRPWVGGKVVVVVVVIVDREKDDDVVAQGVVAVVLVVVVVVV
eukprot:6143344-Pyramimonas_sp.AAC.1